MKLNSTMIKTISLGTLLAVATFSQAAPSGNHAMSGKSYHSMQAAISAAKQSKLTAANGLDPAAYAIVNNPSRQTITISAHDSVGGSVGHTLNPAADPNDTSAWTIDDSNPVSTIKVALSNSNGTILNDTVPYGTCFYVHKDGNGVTENFNCFKAKH